MLQSEIIAVYSDIHIKHTDELCGDRVQFFEGSAWWYIKKPPSLQHETERHSGENGDTKFIMKQRA
jgi:hypothetical protein